jgi:uncharacterized spore protein YtfJ
MDAGNLLDKVSDNLSVRRAFGAAYEKDGTLIIPVAMVAGGGGAGTSRTGRGKPATGRRPEGDDPAHDTAPQDPEPKDAGGGFGGLVMPTGVYVVKGDQVRWVPAVDTTIVVLASLSLVRMLARAWTRRRRGHRDCSPVPPAGAVGGSTPAAGQAGRATVMAELFKDVNTGNGEP